MNAGKFILTFLAGITAGIAAVYFVDRKGSEKKLNSLKKDFKKQSKVWEKSLSNKFNDYKKTYGDMVDKYAESSKEIIDKAKDKVALN